MSWLARRGVAVASSSGIAVAAVAGFALGSTGAVDVAAEGTVDLPAAAVAYHVCPGSGAAGALQRGDRVLLTGRSDDGRWVELRSPEDLVDRVWVPSSAVTPDDRIDLPTHECGESDATGETAEAGETEPIVEQPDGAEETTTTTTTTGGTTTSSTPGPVTDPRADTPPEESAPPPTAPPPTRPTPTTTASPPADTTGPEIHSFERADAALREEGREFCDLPPTTTVRVRVEDPSAVRSVTLRWQLTGGAEAEAGSAPMTLHDGRYEATLGPYRSGTLGSRPASPIRWSVEASDGAGNRRSVDAPPAASVTLQGC